MRKATFQIIVILFGVALFLLACRTAGMFTGAEPTATRVRVTRAAQRPTFTPIPPPSNTPEPTATPEPTQVPPTPEPTQVPPTPEPTRPPNTPRPRPTDPPPTATTAPTAVPTATMVFEYDTSGSSSCEGGGDGESSVTGKISANNKGAQGQRVQASSGPGGEPISENPAESNKDGNYKVTFICGGKACNGDFYIWMVNAERKQISPFVKFNFNGDRRKCVQNFQKR